MKIYINYTTLLPHLQVFYTKRLDKTQKIVHNYSNILTKERAEKMQIDLGGNLLPGFVGGSKNNEICAERLRTLYSAGVDAAVLTPRYYPAKMTVREFSDLRQRMLFGLDKHMPKKCPALYLGSEVYLDERLKYISDIGDLAIVGTRTLIVDMPAGAWESALLDTLYATLWSK